MSKTLKEIAKQLEESKKKVQLIYAFNGTGKTRLSREFKEHVSKKHDSDNDVGDSDLSNKNIIYFSAFTEDLFYWDNDLKEDLNPKLKIVNNSFIKWIIKEQGQANNVATHFQHYTNTKITPKFSDDLTSVSFYIADKESGDLKEIKISKGEESNFIWCVFYALLEELINVLNDGQEDTFNKIKYVFIDDPVSSLDKNHLIELAVNIAELIKKSPDTIQYIITTHNPLFYNVLFNELNSKDCYLLDKSDEDNEFSLEKKNGDSNKSFSYHLHLIKQLQKAIEQKNIERYHFILLRNLYEKTAAFLGYPKWSLLLPDNQQSYSNRIIQFTSHSTLSEEAISEPTPQEKAMVRFLLEHLINKFGFYNKDVA